MTRENLEKDPSIILTAVHAYAVNDLDVDDEIKELINNNLDLIKNIKPEVAYEIFSSIMETNHPERYIREFKEVFFAFIPGLKETYGFKQNNPWHIYDVFEHTMHVIENTKDNKALRIAALFHDLGKPSVYFEETKVVDGEEKTIGRFFGHAKRSKEYFNAFAKALNVPETERVLIERLIVMHDYQLSTKPNKIKQYIEELGPENVPLLFALKRADNLAQNPEKTEQVLKLLDEQEAIFMDYISKNYNNQPEETPVKRHK